MGITVSVDFSRALSKNKKAKTVFNKAMISSLNKVGKKADTEVNAQIRSEYNIKKKDISKAVRLIRARKDRPMFKIYVRSRRIGLLKYGARQTKKGATVKVKNAGGRKLIHHSFIRPWRIGESEEWVMRRNPQIGMIKRKNRRKLEEKREALFGPSVTQLYASKKVDQKVKQIVRANITKLLNHEIEVRLKGIVKAV